MHHSLRAQGATEYLVLLAAVLIIALVSIALLGFFPGTATDAQLTENQLYWKSASPIAIIETGGVYADPTIPALELFVFRIRNIGSYAIRLTDMRVEGVTVTNYVAPGYPGGFKPFTSITLAPGEETCFGNYYIPGQPCQDKSLYFVPPDWPPGGEGVFRVVANGNGCDSQGKGTLVLKNFGFGYIQYVENVPITKSMIGTKPLILKCIGQVAMYVPPPPQ